MTNLKKRTSIINVVLMSVSGLWISIRDSYIDGETKSEKKMAWGLTKEGVGFLQIDAMLDYAEGDDPNLEEELEALNTLLDKVMSDLKDAPSMIIDIRLNGGGSDAISLAIAGRFTGQRLKVMSKKARSFSGETSPLDAGMAEKIVEMAINGSGIRDTARVLNINKNTVIETLKKRKQSCSSQS